MRLQSVTLPPAWCSGFRRSRLPCDSTFRFPPGIAACPPPSVGNISPCAYFPIRPIRSRSTPDVPGGTAPDRASLAEFPGGLWKFAECATELRSHATGPAIPPSGLASPACLAADQSVSPPALLVCLGEKITALSSTVKESLARGQRDVAMQRSQIGREMSPALRPRATLPDIVTTQKSRRSASCPVRGPALAEV